jgi:cellulose synthase/poly-beta-1,6-N-acetylglucosamine synthase-like glycosyltransferase
VRHPEIDSAVAERLRAGRPVPRAPFHDPPPRRPRLPRCPEIDCVRDSLPSWTVVMAELRAAEIGVGADRVLIAEGALTEHDHVTALAADLGADYQPLFAVPRQDCPLTDDALMDALLTGHLPLTTAEGLVMVVAPRLVDSRRLVAAVRENPALAARLRLTTADGLRDFVSRHGRREIEHRAVEALRAARPELSAGSVRSRRFSRRTVVAAGALAAAAAWAVPSLALAALDLALGAVFLAWTGLRLFSTVDRPAAAQDGGLPPDARLPVYTVMVALYREAAGAAQLVAALEALDYPPEKLDIKLVLEPDDLDTRAALARLHLKPQFEVVIAPAAGPRTKPKALNAALPFARGAFVAIYDAEDRPAPGQLRQALAAFVAGDPQLACVQARLTIDNSADSWLARMATAEYAGLFDVLLPSLAGRRLPLPLGGSSNHFRTAVLRRVGGWDPYNVTEDADLGMRLARLGYQTAVIASTTYEETPARFGSWLRQRTRWFKGWMQTWLVHMRTPRLLFHDLGLPGFVVFHLLVGGTVLAALVHALFAARIAWSLATSHPEGLVSFAGFYATTLVIGYLVSTVLALVGLARRRLLSCAWALMLMPLYWVLLSLAAWRALFQLLRDPYRWEKTEHGLARTSRLAGRTPPSR